MSKNTGIEEVKYEFNWIVKTFEGLSETLKNFNEKLQNVTIEDEGKEEKITYSVGDFFVRYGINDHYMLTLDKHYALLVSLENGLVWSEHVLVKNVRSITQDEFAKIVSRQVGTFTKIPNPYKQT